ncbi:MAG: DUF2071 domain-containing protein [Verrucomicrobiales bacterium]|nr:DUF2071 domain-containing protein [Verrucomicrobiales bacterium]
MKLPKITGIIRRRILLNYRVEAEVAEALLPGNFRPKLVNGDAVAGVCLIRLEQIRPVGLPKLLGVFLTNGTLSLKCWLKKEIYQNRMKRVNTIRVWSCLSICCCFAFVVGQVHGSEDALTPGRSVFGANQYIEYIPGDFPLIISAPHGGRLKPASIPDRKKGVLLADMGTDLLAMEMVRAFQELTGKTPHVIICHLKRIKLDCNREIGEAAQGNEEAEQAWREFHGFIERARADVIEQSGRGLYIDLHGHGHPELRLELGYLLSNRELKGDDHQVAELERKSSIRKLAEDSKSSFVELLRGDSSLGALMQERGYPSVPSPKLPHAGEAKYFDGGHNTRIYGSRAGGKISAIQVECPGKTVRNSKENRRAFAKAFASAMMEYLQVHQVLDAGE